MAGQIAPLYIISGGDGVSATQLVNTALAQFPEAELEIHVIPRVNSSASLKRALRSVREAGGSIVHTLVNDALRRELVRRAREENVPQVDAMGRVMRRLSTLLGRRPLGQPGRYRREQAIYFDRVEAIEFAVQHDDGAQPHDLVRADIVLVGVSRTGKTPLTMYLSVQGWKVANVPYVPEVGLPASLKEVDRRRVVGLTIEPARLRQFRIPREQKLSMGEGTAYTDLSRLRDEVSKAERVFRRHGYPLCQVTNRPIEEIAEEVLATVGKRLARAERPIA